MDDDEQFDYLRERSPEQDAAADDVEPNPDAGVPGGRDGAGARTGEGGDVDGERARTAQPGL